MKFRIKDYEDIRKNVDNMSVRQLIDTVCFPHVILRENSEPYHTEAVLFHIGEREVIKSRAEEWTAVNGKEPILTADFECDCSRMIKDSTKMPSYYSFGKVSEDTVYKIGRAVAGEARELGYKWTFSPCVDILMERESPITSIRTAGADPDTVLRTSRAYMKGLHDGGIAATLKHFPGDGASNLDHHLTTGENPLPLDKWRETYGYIYTSLIEDGAMAIMPGHISLPAYEAPDDNGFCPPATLSKRLLSDLLKKELGFEGIIVSDAVNMGGFCGYMNYYRALARFLMCGGDLLLFANPDERLYEHFAAYINEGYLTTEVLRDRAYRVACFAKYLREEFKPIDTCTYSMDRLEKIVAENSVEVVRDRDSVLPYSLTPDTRILHTVIVNNYTSDKTYEALDEKLHSICGNVTTLIDPGCDRLRADIEDGKYDLVICSCGCTFAYGTNVIRMHGALARNLMFGWTKLGTPVIFVNYSSPYLGDEYKYVMDTIVNTYGVSKSTADAVIKLIFKNYLGGKQ